MDVFQIMCGRVAGSAKTDFVIAAKHIMSAIVALAQSFPVNGLTLSAKGRLLMVSAIIPMLYRTHAVWERLEFHNG